jgi:hypothetical protein
MRFVIRASTMKTLFLAGALCLSACGSSSAPAALTDTGNLILNPGAEAAVGSSTGAPVKTPDWTSTGEATALQYGEGGYPASTDPGPPDRGKNLFIGGQDDMNSSLTQSIDVSMYGTAIDGGAVTYDLSGWLGGFSSQDDYATLTVTFLGATEKALATAVIGPVTAEERMDNTSLLEKTKKGTVPVGTRSLKVVLAMVREEGAANDGYADNLSLVFDGV